MQKKLSVPLKELCKTHPSQMIDFIKYCRTFNANADSEFDYEYLHGLVADMAAKANAKTATTAGSKGNKTFDW